MDDHTIEHICAITALVILELFALSEGIDGLMLGGVIATIAGIIGYRYAVTSTPPPPPESQAPQGTTNGAFLSTARSQV
jgi:amino acid permease